MCIDLTERKNENSLQIQVEDEKAISSKTIEKFKLKEFAKTEVTQKIRIAVEESIVEEQITFTEEEDSLKTYPVSQEVGITIENKEEKNTPSGELIEEEKKI